MIALIAAVAQNGVIGQDGQLPWYLPEDLKRFRKLTLGKVVLMGRKTFESIIARLNRPLPDRVNLVVTKQVNYAQNLPSALADNVFVYSSIENALKSPFAQKDIYIIGGGEIYRQTIQLADKLFITEVHRSVSGNVFFPKIDKNFWREVKRENFDSFSFVEYVRKKAVKQNPAD